MAILLVIRSARPIAFCYAVARPGARFPSLYRLSRDYTASEVYQPTLETILYVLI